MNKKLLSDTHCHLNLEDFDVDREQVISRAQKCGLEKILVLGIDYSSSCLAVKMAEEYPCFIYAAVGIHPNYATDKDFEYINKFRRLIKKPEVVAIGEIGLDFYRNFSEKVVQINTFKSMLDLAIEAGKPICLHQRSSLSEMLNILEGWYCNLLNSDSLLAKNPGVFHSFDGNEELIGWSENRPFYFGINGFITYKKTIELRESLRKINPDRLLLETDAPYITPEPERGKRNEPANVCIIARKVGEVLAADAKKISEITSINAKRLFRW